MTENIVWHTAKIDKNKRQSLNRHKSFVIWLTGLSGSGKSTIANALEEELFRKDIRTYLLDGDNVRHGLNNDLGFSIEDRKENIRRIGEVAKLFVDAGVIVITAFISPYKEDRQFVRDILEEDEFYEVYVRCPIEVCESRDPKGLYKKARSGEIKNFTGVSDAFEEPQSPEIIIESDKNSIKECVERIMKYLPL